MLYLLDGLGIETGVDIGKLIAAGEYICGKLGRPTHSQGGRAALAAEGARPCIAIASTSPGLLGCSHAAEFYCELYARRWRTDAPHRRRAA